MSLEDALFDGAHFGDTEAVRSLIGRGADLTSKDCNGLTPLHWAAFSNFPETAKVLLESGADANARDNIGQTPLHRAASSNQDIHEILRLLVAHGADVYAKDNRGWTPLTEAESLGQPSAATALRQVIANAVDCSAGQDVKRPTPGKEENNEEHAGSRNSAKSRIPKTRTR